MSVDDSWGGRWGDTRGETRGDEWGGRRADTPGDDRGGRRADTPGTWGDRWGEANTFEVPARSTSRGAPTAGSYSGVAGHHVGADPRISRRAHLEVSRVDPWSVTKFGFIVALVCFVALFVAVLVLYGLLAALGVFDAVNSVVTSVTATGTDLFSLSRILGYTAFVGGINIVLITLLATVGAYVYNFTAEFVGGIEVTLTEPE